MDNIEAVVRRVLREELSRAGGVSPVALTLEGAAEALSISVSTLRRMVRGGEVLQVLVGRRPRIPYDEVLRLVAPPEQRREPRRAASPSTAQQARSLRAALRSI